MTAVIDHLANLLSGLSQIANLLLDTFSALDITLLGIRMDQVKSQREIVDTLATLGTILANYQDVFVRLDIDTVRMFLKNVDPDVLAKAIVKGEDA